MTRIAFSDKAGTLLALQRRLKHGRVLPIAVIAERNWRRSPDREIAQILSQPWAKKSLIVRSSAPSEDRLGRTQAGRFLSVADVSSKTLAQAVKRVFASYGRSRGQKKLFVQPMLSGTRIAGVAFTRDPASGAPYTTVNYDPSGNTQSVTSGRGGALESQTIVRGRRPPGWMGKLCRVLQELEALLGCDALDVEFAIDATGRPVVFQVRRLLLAQRPCLSDEDHAKVLRLIADRIDCGQQPLPNVVGSRTIYGVMPDWNPAEMIGLRPRPLALSLYKDLITDSIWAYQRNNYGYRNVRSTPLIVSFHGVPYVDVRASFSSFVPKGVPGDLAGRLVDYYIQRLCRTPAFHDKVEFEIVLSCISAGWPDRSAELRSAGFGQADIRSLSLELTSLTRAIIHPKRGLWRTDRAKIDVLSLRQQRLATQRLDDVAHIYWLLEDCKRYGTLPFAGLARAAFVAVQMLRAFVAAGDLSSAEHATFIASVDTVTSRMHRDLATQSRRDFLRMYGHLRPGTYDITSPRYDSTPERYLDFAHRKSPADTSSRFRLSPASRRRIDQFLTSHNLGLAADELMAFCAAAIQGREYGKFVFTRSISDALERLAQFGRRLGIDRDDLSYFDIAALQRLYATSVEPLPILKESIARGRESHAITRQINLPPLILSAADVWSFASPRSSPNFVTHKTAEGPVRASSVHRSRLKGAIVAIPSADPGFDWLFGHGIAGLVTAYGGANSHMSIRAAELGLPAVIGAGERLFKAWSEAARLRIDAANQRVEVLA